jgi:hypothetical protein
MKGVLALLLGCFLAAGPARATDLVWSGQVRVRPEGSDRSFQPRSAEWDFLQRTRLGVLASVSPEVQVFVQAQDSRTWGLERGTLADSKNLDVHQAYADVSHAWNEKQLRVRAGRMELSYGVERIVGAVNWSNVGRSFDALQLRGQRGRLTSDLVAGRLADRSEAPGYNDDLFLTYHRFATAAGDRGAEAYAMYRTTASKRFETTLGEHLFGKRGGFSADEEVAVMTGRRDYHDLLAWLMSVQMTTRLGGRYSVGAGLGFLSGDDPKDGKIQFFDVSRLFQTGHKFYGIMDVAENLAGKAGLVDLYVAFGADGPHGLALRSEVHDFRVDRAEVPLGVPKRDAYLGTEVDLIASLAVMEHVSFELGGAVLAPGARTKAERGDHTATWGYAQGTVSF